MPEVMISSGQSASIMTPLMVDVALVGIFLTMSTSLLKLIMTKEMIETLLKAATASAAAEQPVHPMGMALRIARFQLCLEKAETRFKGAEALTRHHASSGA